MILLCCSEILFCRSANRSVTADSALFRKPVLSCSAPSRRSDAVLRKPPDFVVPIRDTNDEKLAFAAVVVSTLFAQSMLVRYTAGHQPQHRAWAIALAMFALASVALATGTSTGWDNGTFPLR